MVGARFFFLFCFVLDRYDRCSDVTGSLFEVGVGCRRLLLHSRNRELSGPSQTSRELGEPTRGSRYCGLTGCKEGRLPLFYSSDLHPPGSGPVLVVPDNRK